MACHVQEFVRGWLATSWRRMRALTRAQCTTRGRCARPDLDPRSLHAAVQPLRQLAHEHHNALVLVLARALKQAAQPVTSGIAACEQPSERSCNTSEFECGWLHPSAVIFLRLRSSEDSTARAPSAALRTILSASETRTIRTSSDTAFSWPASVFT